MQTLENTPQHAQKLVQAILVSSCIPTFDLDGVLFDATARQKIFNQLDVEQGLCTVDQVGQLDLAAYRANSTAEQISKDKTLPLIAAVHALNALDITYHVATARVACEHTKALLAMHNVKPDKLLARLGDDDHRRDNQLKVDNLCLAFEQRELDNMLLIDDSLGNLKAVQTIGLKAVHVPFRGF